MGHEVIDFFAFGPLSCFLSRSYGDFGWMELYIIYPSFHPWPMLARIFVLVHYYRETRIAGLLLDLAVIAIFNHVEVADTRDMHKKPHERLSILK